MIKVRVAPSPTGFLHIGNAQSALYNWLFARKNGGDFYLRIEDTDKARSTKEGERSIIYGLKWLGLDWSGPVVHQSERFISHRKFLEKLIFERKAFWCNHTKEELEAERQGQEEKKEAPRHICSHKHRFHVPISSPQRAGDWVIRLDVDTNSSRKIIFNDIIRGPIEFDTGLLGDFSIAKNLDNPLYNFAVVVDDSDMEITHVIRGEDHVSNTPKQILIYEALGKTPPLFAHLPLILAPDRSKLSKRHGGTSVVDYKKDYLPEAIINFLGGLSYTFSKDILTKEEMADEFELSKVHRSGAMFDVKKLNWINSQYVKNLLPETFKKMVEIPEIPDKAVPLITERLEKLSDVHNFEYFWKEPEYEKELLKWKNYSLEDVKNSLEKVKKIISNHDLSDKDGLRTKLDNLALELGDPAQSNSADRQQKGQTLGGASRGLVYWPLRVTLTGKEKSPDPVDVACVLTKDRVVKRIKMAIDKL